MTDHQRRRRAIGGRHEPRERIFLVVVDETEEMKNALHFACRRALHTGGRVALFYALEPPSFSTGSGSSG